MPWDPPGASEDALSEAINTKKKTPIMLSHYRGYKSGNDLLSREIPVSSAFESLTTVFGMGTGVTSQVESPENQTPPQRCLVFRRV